MAEDLLKERLLIAMTQEASYVSEDYLSRVQEGMRGIDRNCRQTMAMWVFQMIDFCKFSNETGSIALNYLDRFLSTKQGNIALHDRRIFQLVTMSALEIAIKLHEPVKLDVNLLSELSKGSYSTEDIVQMEECILFALGWRVSSPTPTVFLHMYLDMICFKQRRMLEKLCCIQIDSAVQDYYFVTQRPSEIALAALLNAMDGIECSNTRQELLNTLGLDCSDELRARLEKYLISAVPDQQEWCETRSKIASKCARSCEEVPKSPTCVHKF